MILADGESEELIDSCLMPKYLSIYSMIKILYNKESPYWSNTHAMHVRRLKDDK